MNYNRTPSKAVLEAMFKDVRTSYISMNTLVKNVQPTWNTKEKWGELTVNQFLKKYSKLESAKLAVIDHPELNGNTLMKKVSIVDVKNTPEPWGELTVNEFRKVYLYQYIYPEYPTEPAPEWGKLTVQQFREKTGLVLEQAKKVVLNNPKLGGRMKMKNVPSQYTHGTSEFWGNMTVNEFRKTYLPHRRRRWLFGII